MLAEAPSDDRHPVAVQARDWQATEHGTQARISTPVGELELRSPLVGDYNLDNLMLAVAMTCVRGVPLATIARALETASGAPGRLERVEGPGPRVLVDYAHTPDAVDRALRVLKPTTRGRLWIVLGCGGDRDRSKRAPMAAAALKAADRLVATSDNPRTEDPEAILDDMLEHTELGPRVRREVDRRRAIEIALHEADDEDTVLIAGKGHEDYQILGERKIHFDDREHARELLAARNRAPQS